MLVAGVQCGRAFAFTRFFQKHLAKIREETSEGLEVELKAELKIQLDKEFKGIPYLFISSVAQQGLTELKDKLWAMLNEEVTN